MIVTRSILERLEWYETIGKQNLFFALVYNSAAEPVAAGVLYRFLGILIGPSFATFAMSASSLPAVMNALRQRREKVLGTKGTDRQIERWTSH